MIIGGGIREGILILIMPGGAPPPEDTGPP